MIQISCSVQVLTALGTHLRDKSGNYSDDAIGALFMLNNLRWAVCIASFVVTCVSICILSYLTHTLTKDATLMAVLSNDANHSQVLAFYQSEIEEYTCKYLQSWAKVTAVFSSSASFGDERKASRFIYSVTEAV